MVFYEACVAVYGANVKVNDITIDKVDYGNETYIKAGTRKAINCRGSTRNQRVSLGLQGIRFDTITVAVKSVQHK